MLSRISLLILGSAFFVLAASSAILLYSSIKSTTHLDGQLSAQPGSEGDFIVNVGDRVFFKPKQVELSAAALDTLTRQAAWLKKYTYVRMRISGHTDEQEWYGDISEWKKKREQGIDRQLGLKRAQAVQEALVKWGILRERLEIESWGWEHPVALCDAESCWSQNRRVVLIMCGVKGSPC